MNKVDRMIGKGKQSGNPIQKGIKMIFNIAEIEGYTVTYNSNTKDFYCSHGIAQNFEMIVVDHKHMITACIVDPDEEKGTWGVVAVPRDEFGDVLILEAVKESIELVNK